MSASLYGALICIGLAACEVRREPPDHELVSAWCEEDSADWSITITADGVRRYRTGSERAAFGVELAEVCR